VKKIALLGATGSIGQQTLDLIRLAPDKYQLLAAASSGNKKEEFRELVKEFKPEYIFLENSQFAKELKDEFSITILQNLLEMVSLADINCVVVAVVGAVGIEPTLEAIKHHKDIVLANKETLVAAGDLIKQKLNNSHSQLIPADSEHIALWQCLEGITDRDSTIKKAYLTASGGPFWAKREELDFRQITPAQALQHPTWQMGKKISIDSATMMNKGLEVIEAERLFGLGYERIGVLVHPQSIIHGLLEFCDGAVMAQIAPNDMRLVIQYALDYPQRQNNLSENYFDFRQTHQFDLSPPDNQSFPCLELAYEAGRAGQTYPAVLAAADEVAVECFLQGQISFQQIPQLIERTLEAHKGQRLDSLEVLQEVDHWAREQAQKLALQMQ